MTFEKEMQDLVNEDNAIVDRLKELQAEAETLTQRRYEIRGALKALDSMRARLIEAQKSEEPETSDKVDDANDSHSESE